MLKKRCVSVFYVLVRCTKHIYCKSSVSIADLSFYPANYLTDFMWVGMSGSYIRYLPNSRIWYLVNDGTGITASSNASAKSLLMGKRL